MNTRIQKLCNQNTKFILLIGHCFPGVSFECQRNNKRPQVDVQTIQWSKRKERKNNWSANYFTTKTKRLSNTHEPNKKHGKNSGKVSRSCLTSDTRRVTLVINPVINYNEERTGLWFQQTEYIRGHLWSRYSVTVNHVMVAKVKLSNWRLKSYH